MLNLVVNHLYLDRRTIGLQFTSLLQSSMCTRAASDWVYPTHEMRLKFAKHSETRIVFIGGRKFSSSAQQSLATFQIAEYDSPAVDLSGSHFGRS